MKGAELAYLFETGQYGRLYITSSRHARGETLRIQVLPEGQKAKPNGSMNLCTNKDAVLVYGVISGNPGWTEEYGWLHHGPWKDDFYNLVKEKQEALEKDKAEREARIKAKKKSEEERINNLLSNY